MIVGAADHSGLLYNEGFCMEHQIAVGPMNSVVFLLPVVITAKEAG